VAGLALASALVSLAAAELVLRAVVPDRPLVTVSDPIAGSFRRPSLSFRYTDEGDGWVDINRHGQRDSEREEQKPDGTFRIAVLGDSYAEAFQVDREETFWSLLETRLAACGAFGARVEVLNFGVSSYGTAQELLTLRHRVWPFDPDLVLLAFLTGNDVRNNSKRLETEAPLRPFFELAEDGSLRLDESFLRHPLFLRSRSRAFSLLRSGADHLRILQLLSRARYAASQRAPARPAAEPVRAGREAGLDHQVYLGDVDETWSEAWRITEGILAEMNREVRARNAGFRVVTLSNGIQVHPEAERTERFARELGSDDLFLPDRRVAAIGAKLGFPVSVLAPRLQRIARDRGIHLHGFGPNLGNGHWNENGHRHAADLIADDLCAEPSAGRG
jgi:hypothetical protein